MRKPFQVTVIFKAKLSRDEGGPGVHRADEAKAEEHNREDQQD